MENINQDVINLQNLQEAKRKLNKISYAELTAEQEDYITLGENK